MPDVAAKKLHVRRAKNRLLRSPIPFDVGESAPSCGSWTAKVEGIDAA